LDAGKKIWIRPENQKMPLLVLASDGIWVIFKARKLFLARTFISRKNWEAKYHYGLVKLLSLSFQSSKNFGAGIVAR
jgi:hypothetical protein